MDSSSHEKVAQTVNGFADSIALRRSSTRQSTCLLGREKEMTQGFRCAVFLAGHVNQLVPNLSWAREGLGVGSWSQCVRKSALMSRRAAHRILPSQYANVW